MAQDRRSDPGRIKHETTDLQRDIAAKGGPATGLGDAQNRKASNPADHEISSTHNRSSQQAQSDAAKQSADNDMDRLAKHHDISKDADEAQSDGDLSFPEGK